MPELEGTGDGDAVEPHPFRFCSGPWYRGIQPLAWQIEPLRAKHDTEMFVRFTPFSMQLV